MIRKFNKIKNVGQFKDFSASGEISFDKVNIIYGENSVGKTTLTSIIQSLILNKPELILERKTFGASDDQSVELFFNDENIQLFKFKDGNWNIGNDNLKNIEIFDEFFVNENIFTGTNILPEHQKCLYRFAVGEKGVTLANEIEKIKKDLLSNKHPELNSLVSQIKILIEEYFELDDFINLPEGKEIDKKIDDKKWGISSAEAFNEIRQKRFLNEISLLSFQLDIGNLKNLLRRSLTTISRESSERTTHHITTLADVLKKDAESWLYQGLVYVEKTQNNQCPFCLQDLTKAKATIRVYQQYFNEEYKKFKEDIDTFSKQINGFNIELSLSNIKGNVLSNDALIEFWKKFLPPLEFPELKDLDQHNEQIVELFKSIKSLIEKKQKNILGPIDKDDINKLLDSVKNLNENVNSYNSKVKIWNEKIKKLKAKQPDIEKLKNELKKLEIQKKRYSKEIKNLCNEYMQCQNDIKKLNKSVKGQKEKLKSVISQEVEKYGEETNRILEKFRVPFKIVKLAPRYRGSGEEPYFEYFLEIEGHEINPLQKAKFTLSGGDKNALALAFFLTKINIYKNIENKIIIFDDPISSLDTNRKRRTIEFIRDLSNKTKQVIVLTHHNIFAFELYDTLRDSGIKPKCLQIIKGAIKEWDINEDKKHPFFKNLSKLEAFLNDEEEMSVEEARRLIRITLEDKLKFGYFQFFKDIGNDFWLGEMIGRLRDLKSEPSLKFKHSDKEEVINELGNLCDFSSPSHHSNITIPYKTNYTRTEIVNYVKSTLELIYEWL